MGDDTERANPLNEAMRESPLGQAQKQLAALRDNWAKHDVAPLPVPLSPKDPDIPGRDWFPEPRWISGLAAFELLRLQTEPYEWAPPMARICQIIADQWDREEFGLNYVLDTLPPNHELLECFAVGSTQWFRALYTVLTLGGKEATDGWEALVSDLYDWLGPYDRLRLRTADVLHNALTHHWSVREYSLPEAKQEPVWSFPRAMAWIATRDYLALARMGFFRRPSDEDEAVATEGVCKYNTEALGWLHTEIAYTHCKCGALSEFGLEAYKHCTCISVAWEELVHLSGGLAPETPELVFNLQEGWLSMTWPDGAGDLRYLRRDILERWPPKPTEEPSKPAKVPSISKAENECKEWLLSAFADDHEKKRSKRSFQDEALERFPRRLSVRGFMRVWDALAPQSGRSTPGRKS